MRKFFFGLEPTNAAELPLCANSLRQGGIEHTMTMEKAPQQQPPKNQGQSSPYKETLPEWPSILQ